MRSKTPKPMNPEERRHWLEIRAGFKEYASGLSNSYTFLGMCDAVDSLGVRYAMFTKMRGRLRTYRPRGKSVATYWWPLSPEGARKRVKWIDRLIKKHALRNTKD